ncbi:hypothetical protein PGTUg99_014117 [Puccinia graminis f. sp. tritici]|uniref:Uncharacterized protein n=1 Tax=Puccinia graminis f. sp. tritici TaxID=56615 RepID=A0A5B0RV80_PUCGR|nr:hypothetical protein PGTUg99_014117 [Puccinia graminis f. sp. tritici]
MDDSVWGGAGLSCEDSKASTDILLASGGIELCSRYFRLVVEGLSNGGLKVLTVDSRRGDGKRLHQ